MVDSILHYDSKKFYLGKQDDYSKYRPTYPEQLFYYLKNTYKTQNLTMVELGAGTGKFSNIASGIFKKVYFVEPNIDMLNKGKEYCSKRDNIVYVNCSAEDIKIPDNSADMIFAVQSFHWFDKEKLKIEAQRILKNDGFFAIVWNDLEDKNNEFSRAYFNYINVWNTKITGRKYEHKSVEDKVKFFKNGKFTTLDFLHSCKYSVEMLMGLTRSLSYAPQENDEYYREFYDGVLEIFEKYQVGGYVTFNIHTIMHVGKI